MDEVLMSQFIDNELDLQEKIRFIECLQAIPAFSSEMQEMLTQESILHDLSKYELVSPTDKKHTPVLPRSRRRQHLAAAVALLICSLLLVHILQRMQTTPQALTYRLVLYRPAALQVNVIGTFTGWSPVPMERIGTTGYWILTLQIPPGEHRYSFLLDRGGQMADPTVAAREDDDFGGENSILIVEGDDEPIS